MNASLEGKQIVVLFNGQSRRSGEGERVRESLRRLEARGFRIVEREPLSAEALSAVAEDAPEDAIIVAAGGDGTVQAVANGLLCRAIPDAAEAGPHGKASVPVLGVLPMGTANDFARSLGLGRDPADAIAVLENGTARWLDAVRVLLDDECFWMVNAAAGGNAAEVNRRVDKEMKRRWGPWCYVRGVADVLGDLQSYDVRLQIDDAPALEFNAFNVLVANGRSVGGVEAAGRADLEDGQLEVIVVKEAPLLKTAEVAIDFLSGDYLDSGQVFYQRGRRATVECERSMGFSVDGELKTGRAVTFTVVPAALRVLVGPHYRAAAPQKPVPRAE